MHACIHTAGAIPIPGAKNADQAAINAGALTLVAGKGKDSTRKSGLPGAQGGLSARLITKDFGRAAKSAGRRAKERKRDKEINIVSEQAKANRKAEEDAENAEAGEKDGKAADESPKATMRLLRGGDKQPRSSASTATTAPGSTTPGTVPGSVSMTVYLTPRGAVPRADAPLLVVRLPLFM